MSLCGYILSYFSGSADPLSTTSSKALDAIGKDLQAQYERWQPRVRIVSVLSILSSHSLCFRYLQLVIAIVSYCNDGHNFSELYTWLRSNRNHLFSRVC